MEKRPRRKTAALAAGRCALRLRERVGLPLVTRVNRNFLAGGCGIRIFAWAGVNAFTSRLLALARSLSSSR